MREPLDSCPVHDDTRTRMPPRAARISEGGERRAEEGEEEEEEDDERKRSRGESGHVVAKNGCQAHRLLKPWPMPEVKKHRPQEKEEEETR